MVNLRNYAPGKSWMKKKSALIKHGVFYIPRKIEITFYDRAVFEVVIFDGEKS